MKIGLFFGTYNPIHVGHMVIANYMVEFTELDRIWIVVSPHNPFKEKKSLLADYHRLQLVRIAIGDDIRFKASDIEFKLPQPSYTIHTLAYLKEKYPENEYVLVMGADNLKNFHKWKNYEEILKEHEIYVYPRIEGNNIGELKNHPKVSFHEAPIMRISSSFIRESISAKKDVRHYMPKDVYEYIEEMHFYEKI
ncbi:MAG TPA: nicotinic acid mononucleotide adenylyltransferase [Flavobacteriales bacterium]|nr:nicotinic acid mononucleotide adenylyltransferase [Flavobacteriales bacterium]